jgi:tRNA threonylcarbamoyladenosine biosynthesis protein TsaB
MTSRALFRVERLLGLAAGARPVLGIDTATEVASIALAIDGKIAATLERPTISHGAALPGAVDELLRNAGVTIRDLGAIAAGIGPGSFTGLRVGLGYAKGIATASGCAIVGVPSFDAIALAVLKTASVPIGTLICPVVDARKGEAYCALYRVTADGLDKVLEEAVVTVDDLASRVAGEVVFAGDAKAKEAAQLHDSKHRSGAQVLEMTSLGWRGATVAAIGAARLCAGETDRAAVLEPLYIRSPEATFKPAMRNRGCNRTEVVWSTERKNSFGSM